MCQQFALARQPGVIKAGSATDAIDQRRPRQSVGNQRGRRRIPDAHFAETDNVASFVSQIAGNVRASNQCSGTIGGIHRRLVNIVACAVADAGVDQPVALSKIMRHPGVDDLQRQAVLPCENVDCRTTDEKVLDHLPGYILGESRNAGFGCAVVSGKDQQMRLRKLRCQRLLNPTDLQCQPFELAERTERFGLVVDLGVQHRIERILDRENGKLHGQLA